MFDPEKVERYLAGNGMCIDEEDYDKLLELYRALSVFADTAVAARQQAQLNHPGSVEGNRAQQHPGFLANNHFNR